MVLAISDSGVGMSKEVLKQAFDPFFTTKEIGQGTGLGLSQVYGFMKQSGGHVKIYSEPGDGTTVKMYLPRLVAADTHGTVAAKRDEAAAAGNESELILVVEDEEDVRAATVTILRDLGYGVIEAADGPGALRLLTDHDGVRLLFTDIGLPGGLTGRQLADQRRHCALACASSTRPATRATRSCTTGCSIPGPSCWSSRSNTRRWQAGYGPCSTDNRGREGGWG